MPPTTGEIVATNIASHMTRLGWEYDQLAEATGIPWGDLVHHRADASNMLVNEVAIIADTFGVDVSDLLAEEVDQC